MDEDTMILLTAVVVCNSRPPLVIPLPPSLGPSLSPIVVRNPPLSFVMPNGPYRRVSQGEDASSNGNNSSRPRSERFMDKIYALLWIILALLVARWTRFATIIFTPDERVVKPLLYSAFCFLGINTVLLLYLTIYLPRFKGITDSSAWDVYCPRVVPTMTALGILCALFLVRATWSVWGFLAPLILGIQAFGCLFVTHFIPWFG